MQSVAGPVSPANVRVRLMNRERVLTYQSVGNIRLPSPTFASYTC